MQNIVFVAESSPAEDKSLVKKTKCHKRTVKSTKETAAGTDVKAEKAQYAASCDEEQKKCKRHTDINMQRTSACKLFNVPQTGLYEYLLAKLKRPAFVAKMRKQLVKHEGSVQCGKDVVCIAKKNLVKLLRILDTTDNTDVLKSGKKRTARRLSKLLQVAVHL